MAKILAVDDEPAILEMIESILNKDGHLVTKVSNPLKINMEELHRYDLILLDIMMPGIDGFELCKRISTRCQKEFGLVPLQIHVHRDEGHTAARQWKPNLHAHIVWRMYNEHQCGAYQVA